MKYSIPKGFEEIYDSAIDEYSDRGVFFLDTEYIRSLNEKNGAFRRTFDWLSESAGALALDREAAIYALFLCRAMDRRSDFMANLADVIIPDNEYPAIAILSLLAYVDRLHDYLISKALPDDVIEATLMQFEDCLFLYEERFGYLGLSKRYFDHMQGYIDHNILNVGRLRFEPCKMRGALLLESRITGEQCVMLTRGKMRADGLYSDTPPISENGVFDVRFYETDCAYVGNPVDLRGRCRNELVSFDKSEYFIRINEGDDCLAVHIPSKGALGGEACDESYRRAAEIFARLYPDRNFKGFCCSSWMMAPELDTILPSGSNIVDFQSRYLRYPNHTEGKDVMNFVFKTTVPKNYADLPESTSLQRALKRIYINGGYLYEYKGIFSV